MRNTICKNKFPVEKQMPEFTNYLDSISTNTLLEYPVTAAGNTTNTYLNYPITALVNTTATNTSVEGSELLSGQMERIPLALKVLCSILMVLIILIGCLGNSVMCLIVYRKPAMRSAINILLANMALSDILTSLFCMTCSFITQITDVWLIGDVICKLITCLQEFFVSAGIFILLTISVDRYMIIVRRRDKLTMRHTKFFVTTAWFVSALLVVPPLFGWGHYKMYPGHTLCILELKRDEKDFVYLILKINASFFIPMSIMTFTYLCIIHRVRTNTLRIHNHPTLDFSVSITQTSGKLGIPIIHRINRGHTDVSFKTRSFKTILILFVTLNCCWLPYGIHMLVSNINGSYGNIRNTVILWIGFTKSAINPIIYFKRIEKFREACCDLTPDMLKIVPKLPMFAKRRVNPSTAYECHELPSTL